MKAKKLPSSYDIIGSREKAVAIVEIPEGFEKKEKEIAQQILTRHKNVKSVLKKISERKGIFRKREFEFLLGDENTEVVHKESGCLFKLNPRKVYFSGREGTERLRIVNQVKPKETIMIMFSGVAPFPILIAKKHPNVKKIYAIELNPLAHDYAKENLRINKLEDKIVLIRGNVKKICFELRRKFDRIVMPLPIEGKKFLNLAISCLKKRGIIHFYSLASEPDLFVEAEEFVKDVAKKIGKKFRILNKKKVLPYGPRKWKIVLDILFW